MSSSIKKCIAALSLIVVISVLANISHADKAAKKGQAAGFTYSLFDGKTLSGWTIENGCKASVRDGAILLEEGNGWLRSDHAYTDFKLQLEWKALQAEAYDAGIYIRTHAGGDPFPKKGYQVNLLQGKEGAIGNLTGANAASNIRKGEWNRFEITVVGSSVELSCNGVRAYKVDGVENSTGHIGFQIEVPKGGQYLIRDVQVTELQYTSLFDGKSLAGWEGGGSPAESCWDVVDGTIQCNGKKGPWLRTLAEHGDFNFRFEYQVSPGGNSGIYVRVPKNGNHHRENDTLPEAGFEVQVLDDAAPKYAKLKPYQYCGSVYDIAGAKELVGKPAGIWNTLEINCHGQNITTTHNGVEIVHVTPEEHPLIKLRKVHGYLGLQNHSTVVKFRNLRIGPALER